MPGSVVSFCFDTKGGDIGFSISFIAYEEETSESVVDLARVSSDIETITGTFEVPRVGIVNFLWDNSFSWLTAKTLAYKVTLDQKVYIFK